MSHGANGRVTMKESCLRCEWVMSHVRMSHASHTNEYMFRDSCVYETWLRHDSVMPHIQTSICHIWVMATCKWVMGQVDDTLCEWVMFCMWMSHVSYTHESRMSESLWSVSRGAWMTHYVTSHMWMSHVLHVNESCLIYEWVMSHIRMSHVSYTNESCLIYEWVMSHIRMSHVSCMKESHLIYEWVMSENLNESCLIYKRVVFHIRMSRGAHINASCHICKFVMSQRKRIKPHPLQHRRAPSSWPPATSHVQQYKWVMSNSINESCPTV